MAALETESAARRSVVGHYRVTKNVYESLEGEARAHGVSLNTLVSQVLSNHAQYDLLFDEVGSMRMTKDGFLAVLDMLSDERLVEWGQAFAKSGPDSLMFARKGSISLDAILDSLRLYSKVGWYSMHEAKRNGMEYVTFIHCLGPKYSTILGASITALFAEVGIRPKIMSTHSSVTIEY